MKKISKVLLTIISGIMLTSCSSDHRPSVMIYSTAESFRNEMFQEELDKKFPEYNITVQYIPTGNCAARLKAEGTDIEADIIFESEYTYAEELKDFFYDLSDYDFSKYLDEMVPKHKKYATSIRYSGAIIVNEDVLREKGLDEPTSYEDLLDPKYKGLISMPSPKASGTGYMFLKNLVNEMGEKEAFAYFDKLTNNILQYTSSGSGPVNALVQGEVAIGLGMTFQAVQEINKGANLKILFFEEGAPWTTSVFAIVDGHQNKEGVQEVFRYFFDELVQKDKEMFLPEQIYKDQNTTIKNYPANIIYGDMSNNTAEERLKLLRQWIY